MLKFAFKTFAAAFAALLCASLFAETKTEGGYTLRLKAVKDGSEYKIGDTAQFALYITKDGKPVDGIDVRSEITKDTVNMGNTSQGKTKKGVFRASGKLSEAGFLKCRMRAEIPLADGKKKAVDMLAGAAFEPLKIKPSLPAPDDFDAYWAKQKKILAAIPANAKATFVKSVGGIKVFDIQADTFNGKLSGYLAYPENAEKGTLPAIITTHGWGVRGSSFNGVVAWAKRGFLAFDFNANGLPNGKPAQFYKDLKAGALKNYHIGDWKDRDGLFFRTLFMRDMRAIDFVVAQPQWDGKNLVVCGGSQGGGQALAMGGLDSRVSIVVAGYPAICDHSGPVAGRTSGWPHYTKLDKNGNYNKVAVESARYVDAMNFAARIKGKTMYLINFADDVCEPTSSYAAYNNIKGEKRLWTNEEARHMPAAGTWQTVQKWAVDEVKKSSPKVRMTVDPKSTW